MLLTTVVERGYESYLAMIYCDISLLGAVFLPLLLFLLKKSAATNPVHITQSQCRYSCVMEVA